MIGLIKLDLYWSQHKGKWNCDIMTCWPLLKMFHLLCPLRLRLHQRRPTCRSGSRMSPSKSSLANVFSVAQWQLMRWTMKTNWSAVSIMASIDAKKDGIVSNMCLWGSWGSKRSCISRVHVADVNGGTYVIHFRLYKKENKLRDIFPHTFFFSPDSTGFFIFLFHRLA